MSVRLRWIIATWKFVLTLLHRAATRVSTFMFRLFLVSTIMNARPTITMILAVVLMR
jgi:hypothetical protein